MRVLVLVALGGALGAAARYGFGGWVHGALGAAFPWGTFAVNVVGSFLLGFAMQVLQSSTVTPEMRAFVTVGLLGAFTTFSTFTYEAILLAQAGQWGRAAAYAGGSLAVGLVAVLAGLGLASALLQARG